MFSLLLLSFPLCISSQTYYVTSTDIYGNSTESTVTFRNRSGPMVKTIRPSRLDGVYNFDYSSINFNSSGRVPQRYTNKTSLGKWVQKGYAEYFNGVLENHGWFTSKLVKRYEFDDPCYTYESNFLYDRGKMIMNLGSSKCGHSWYYPGKGENSGFIVFCERTNPDKFWIQYNDKRILRGREVYAGNFWVDNPKPIFYECPECYRDDLHIKFKKVNFNQTVQKSNSYTSSSSKKEINTSS